MLKKLISIATCVAMLMSGMTAFASTRGEEVAPNEQPYGSKYVYHPLFKFTSDSSMGKSKLSNPANYAAHISEIQSYSGSKALYLDSHDSWWKQWFSTSHGCELTKENSNVDAGNGTYYVTPDGKNIEFRIRISGEFAHTVPNAGLVDNDGTFVKFSEMSLANADIETINGVTWRTYKYNTTWPGTGYLLGIGGTHACGSYFDDIYLKVGDVVVIDEDFEDAVNTDLSTVDELVASAYGNDVRISWRNPYLSPLTKIDVYDITDGGETSVLALSAEDAELAPNVVFTANKDCYFDIKGAAGADKQYKIVTSTSSFTNVATTVNFTYVEKTIDVKPYETIALRNKYFKFDTASSLANNKVSDSENFAVHVSDVNSYSGSKSMYIDCNNVWWKQFFHTNFGCELTKENSNVDGGNGVYYVNPINNTIDFSMKLAGDFEKITANAGLLDDTNQMVKFGDMDYTSETIDGVEWRTYTYNDTWSGTGWLFGIGGTYATGAYIDDIYLKVNSVVVMNEDFESTVNVDISKISNANVTPIDDTTLRLGWTNPYYSPITKLEIYDITDGTEKELISLSAVDTQNAPNVVFDKRGNCYYDITGLEAQSYKKYKIVTATAQWGESEALVEGRTMKAENNITVTAFDENGFPFGGSWRGNIGDSATGDGGTLGKWSIEFDEKKSGNASYKFDYYNKSGRLQWSYDVNNGMILSAGETYTFEVYAKVAEGMSAAKASVWLISNGVAKYAKELSTNITDDDWQKLTYAFTPTEDTAITTIRLGLFGDYPTTILVDDVKLSSSSDKELVKPFYTDSALVISEPEIVIKDGATSIEWKQLILNSDTVGEMGCNVYYIDEDGTETKLNDTPVTVLDEISTNNSYVINEFLPGTYEVRTVSSLGVEGEVIRTVVEDVSVSEGTFKGVLFWNEGFNEYGEDYDYEYSYDINTMSKNADTLGTINVANFSDEYKNGLPVCLIGALYKEGTLVNIVKNPVESVPYGEVKNLSVAFETTSIQDLTGYKMKLFVWNTAEGMIPLMSGSVPAISGPEA